MDQGQFFSALGVVWVFGFAAVLLVAWNIRNKRQLEKLNIIHEERMKAMEKGIPLPEFPELSENESKVILGKALASNFEARRWNPRWPLGVGVLLIMGGVGTSVAMRMSAWKLHNELWPFGMIGVFVGVGMFLFYALTRTTSNTD
jgi:hypothetical protein